MTRHRSIQHYRVDQLTLGVYRWRTPHGLARVLTPTGTRTVELITNDAGEPIGEVYDTYAAIEPDRSG